MNFCESNGRHFTIFWSNQNRASLNFSPRNQFLDPQKFHFYIPLWFKELSTSLLTRNHGSFSVSTGISWTLSMANWICYRKVLMLGMNENYPSLPLHGPVFRDLTSVLVGTWTHLSDISERRRSRTNWWLFRCWFRYSPHSWYFEWLWHRSHCWWVLNTCLLFCQWLMCLSLQNSWECQKALGGCKACHPNFPGCHWWQGPWCWGWKAWFGH